MNKSYKILVEFFSMKKEKLPNVCGRVPLKNVITQVTRIISENLGIKQQSIKLETVYKNLHTDSLDDVQIVMDLEEEFGFDISDEEAKDFGAKGDITIKDIVNYICKKLIELKNER